MSKSDVVNYGSYFKLPNPGLKTYFGRVRKGNDVEFRTEFYSGKSLDEIVNGWTRQLNALKGRWPTLLDYEIDLAKKVGPMSIMLPLSERIADIDAYYEDILQPQSPIKASAIAAVLKEWQHVRGMQIRDQYLTISMMKKSTNSGSPYFTKRRDIVDKTYPCTVFQSSDDTFQILKDSDWKACAVLGWRGQEGGREPEDVKQRVVWMFPFAVNIQELQVYQPLIEHAQKFNLVPSWVSMEAVDKHITRMFDTKGKQDDVICTDFSKFDQHFGPACQNAAKTILDGILSKGNSQDWLSNVFPIKYHIPLTYDYGKIRSGHHGMGSGSGGTNADETLVHRALQYEAAQSVNAKLNLYSQCLGDDGVLTYPGISIEDIIRTYTSHGLEMNETKQYVSKFDCTYLRRWHHIDYRQEGICVGVYSTCRALGRLCEQERFVAPEQWGMKMVALRQLSILENVKYHPLRNEFVEYCMKGDKYRLGIDIPDFLRDIDTIAQEAIDHMPDFLGYTKSIQGDAATGISQWWIVQYLKSKA